MTTFADGNAADQSTDRGVSGEPALGVLCCDLQRIDAPPELPI